MSTVIYSQRECVLGWAAWPCQREVMLRTGSEMGSSEASERTCTVTTQGNRHRATQQACRSPQQEHSTNLIWSAITSWLHSRKWDGKSLSGVTCSCLPLSEHVKINFGSTTSVSAESMNEYHPADFRDCQDNQYNRRTRFKYCKILMTLQW